MQVPLSLPADSPLPFLFSLASTHELLPHTRTPSSRRSPFSKLRAHFETRTLLSTACSFQTAKTESVCEVSFVSLPSTHVAPRERTFPHTDLLFLFRNHEHASRANISTHLSFVPPFSRFSRRLSCQSSAPSRHFLSKPHLSP